MPPEAATVLPRRRGTSLGQAVMNDLAARIRAGSFRPGDKLPTEPEIMAAHGVSRTVVREAISRLQAAGLAETRHGVGTFVLAPPATAPLDAYAVVTLHDLLMMLELRISLETEAAGLAAQRRTDAQVALLRQTLADVAQGADGGARGVNADFQFHLQVAQSTGNRYFEDFYRHLGPTTLPRDRLDLAARVHETDADPRRQLGREHQAIVDAIERRDADMARAAMRLHLTNSRERLRLASHEPAP